MDDGRRRIIVKMFGLRALLFETNLLASKRKVLHFGSSQAHYEVTDTLCTDHLFLARGTMKARRANMNIGSLV
jgi:hypothetical protein